MKIWQILRLSNIGVVGTALLAIACLVWVNLWLGFALIAVTYLSYQASRR